MQYQRSYLQKKQTNKDQYSKIYNKSYTKKQYHHFNDKQNYHYFERTNHNQPQSFINKSQSFINKPQSFLNDNKSKTNHKHITSQMINQFQYSLYDKTQRITSPYDKKCSQPSYNNSKPFQQIKKFNAKGLQIQSKLNKIQSFHNKIENLLQMVNKQSKRSKTPQTSTPLTPYNNKTNNYALTSRSLSKLKSPLIQNNKDKIQNLNLRAKLQGNDLSFDKNNQNQLNMNYSKGIKSSLRGYQGDIQSKFPNYGNQYQNYKQSARKNNYGDQLFRNSPFNNKINKQENKQAQDRQRSKLQNIQKSKQNHLQKSKQYMKHIQGQVKDIQNTIELLNQKIKQVDHTPFKKHITFQNLSSSNPQSFSQSQQKKKDQQNSHSVFPQNRSLLNNENNSKDISVNERRRYRNGLINEAQKRGKLIKNQKLLQKDNQKQGEEYKGRNLAINRRNPLNSQIRIQAYKNPYNFQYSGRVQVKRNMNQYDRYENRIGQKIN